MEQMVVHFQTDKAIPTAFWGSLLHGMLMQKLPEAWGDKMHNDGLHPFGQWVEPLQGREFLWHINLLDDALADALAPLVQPDTAWACEHLQDTFHIAKVDRTRLTVQDYVKPFFLEQDVARRWQLRFRTATTHKTQGEYALYPTVELIGQSLQRRFCLLDANSVLADAEALEHILTHTRIARYRLQSCTYPLEGARVQGYVGSVELALKGPESLARLAGMLFSFARWSGVGVKTALGMGGCEVTAVIRKETV